MLGNVKYSAAKITVQKKKKFAWVQICINLLSMSKYSSVDLIYSSFFFFFCPYEAVSETIEPLEIWSTTTNHKNNDKMNHNNTKHCYL